MFISRNSSQVVRCLILSLTLFYVSLACARAPGWPQQFVGKPPLTFMAAKQTEAQFLASLPHAVVGEGFRILRGPPQSEVFVTRNGAIAYYACAPHDCDLKASVFSEPDGRNLVLGIANSNSLPPRLLVGVSFDRTGSVTLAACQDLAAWLSGIGFLDAVGSLVVADGREYKILVSADGLTIDPDGSAFRCPFPKS